MGEVIRFSDGAKAKGLDTAEVEKLAEETTPGAVTTLLDTLGALRGDPSKAAIIDEYKDRFLQQFSKEELASYIRRYAVADIKQESPNQQLQILALVEAYMSKRGQEGGEIESSDV